VKKPVNSVNVMHLSAYLAIGGASRSLINLLKTFYYMDDVNSRLFVLSDDIAEPHRQTLEHQNIGFDYLNKQEMASKWLTLKKLLKTIKTHNIHIIHCDSLLPKKWSIILKTLMPGLKLVYTVRDTNIMNRSSAISKLAGNVFFNTHTAISQAVYDECVECKLKNVRKIYNGINIKDYLSEPRKTEDSSCLKIINVSRIDYPKKGQDVLIKALGECHKRGINFECLIVGSVGGDPTDKKENQYEKNRIKFEEYKQMIKELGIEDKVHFLGNRDDVPELLTQNDIFILSSRTEGFGLVIIEAMAAGLPVISSNIDGPGELITHNENGLLFENENHVDLADKIQYLNNNRQRMYEIAKTGNEFSKNFDIKVVCKNFLNLYREILNS